MTSHGVVRKSIVGDGNCLFRAMADQLGLGEDQHACIRAKVVEQILREKEYFTNFIAEEDNESVEAYCSEIAQNGKVS